MGTQKNSKLNRSFAMIKAILLGTMAVAAAGFITVGVVSLSEKPDESAEVSSSSETETEAKKKEPVIEALTEREKREIVIVSDDELAALEESYSMTPQKFFIGAIFAKDPDGSGRPSVVNGLSDSFADSGLSATFYASSKEQKKVSFVFMAEGDGTYAEQVLDLLAEYGIKSTFFVTREFEGNHTDIIRRMIAEGHEIGNRSYLDPAEGIVKRSLADQMADAKNLQDYMQRTYQYTMQKYSFNQDIWTEASVGLFNKMGYEVCFGSINIIDDTPDPLDAAPMIASLKENLHPGAVYSFHLVNAAIPNILPKLIDYCVEQEYVLKQLD